MWMTFFFITCSIFMHKNYSTLSISSCSIMCILWNTTGRNSKSSLQDCLLFQLSCRNLGKNWACFMCKDSQWHKLFNVVYIMIIAKKMVPCFLKRTSRFLMKIMMKTISTRIKIGIRAMKIMRSIACKITMLLNVNDIVYQRFWRLCSYVSWTLI